MKTSGIAVYGAGGFAREVAWLVEECNKSGSSFKVVCFIDDDENVLEMIETGLSSQGYQCQTAADAESALEIISYHNIKR